MILSHKSLNNSNTVKKKKKMSFMFNLILRRTTSYTNKFKHQNAFSSTILSQCFMPKDLIMKYAITYQKKMKHAIY
jgi:hypothetical protein